jgi:hypothetical protein
MAACSSLSSAPIATKDRVIHDVDATSLPPQPDAALGPDSPFAPDDSGDFGAYYDASAILSICAATPAADASQEREAASADASSCDPLPSACENEPDCECLFRVLASQIPCAYPHCSIDNGFKLYCPP